MGGRIPGAAAEHELLEPKVVIQFGRRASGRHKDLDDVEHLVSLLPRGKG